MHLTRWTFVITGATALCLAAQISWAAPPGSKYAPGETLDPSCAVGDTNCSVVAPLQTTNNLSDIASTSAARTNLGLVINTDVQGYSAALASIGNLTTAANKMIYTTASNTYATTDLTAAARSLLAATTTGAMVTLLRASTGSVADNAVTSAKILDGTIANSDISASAAIPFSKLNIVKSDITGLGIPGSDTDTTYSAGNGLALNGTTFSILPTVVTGAYSYNLKIRGNVTVTGSTVVSGNSRYAGNLLVYGTVTANAFEGDASLLTNVQLPNASVTSAKIIDGAISNNHIDAGAAIAFSKLNISKSDITGLGIPGEDTDTTYTAGTGLQLTGQMFSINSSVVTSNYGAGLILAGNISPHAIVASVSNAGIPNSLTNTSSNSNAGVLKLTLSNIAAPGSSNHYLEFHDSNGLIGSIRGNGAGSTELAWSPSGDAMAFSAKPGLQLVSSGADYAEYLERSDHEEVLRPGDIVGVKEGKISRSTDGADRAMVVSAAPIVVGNMPAGDAAGFTTVAFVGQVHVRVAGPVTSGQYIVASGGNDGIGVAKDKGELTAGDLVVGQAWETVAATGETAVNIGIVPGPVISASNADVERLRSDMQALREEMERLKAALHE